MKTRVIACLLPLLIASLCSGQTVGKVGTGVKGIVVVGYEADGVYLVKITVDGGVASVSPLKIDYHLGDSPDPPPPDDLTDRGKKVRDAAFAVSGDPKRAETAKGLAQAYRQIRGWIDDGTLKGEAQIVKSVKAVVDMVLKHQDAVKPWQPVRDVVSSQWAAVQQAGGSDSDYAKLLDEVADGLDASAPMAQIDPEFLEFLMQLFEFFIKYILPLIT